MAASVAVARATSAWSDIVAALGGSHGHHRPGRRDQADPAHGPRRRRRRGARALPVRSCRASPATRWPTPASSAINMGASLAVVTGIAWFGLFSATSIVWTAIVGAAVVGRVRLRRRLAGPRRADAAQARPRRARRPRPRSPRSSPRSSCRAATSPRASSRGRSAASAAPPSTASAPSCRSSSSGFVISMLSARSLNSLALGDELAAGLGETRRPRPGRRRARRRCCCAAPPPPSPGRSASSGSSSRTCAGCSSAWTTAGCCRSRRSTGAVPADRLRRGRPHRRPPERARRRHHHRADRRPVLHRHRPPAEGARAVSRVIVDSPSRSTVDAVARASRRRAAPRRPAALRRRRARRPRRRRRSPSTLMVGQTFYPPGDVLRVILGEDVPGASFTVGRLRLPRAVLAVVAGLSFGLAGVTFQTMLRNPLASPDIIGITSGASAAAAFAIVSLSLERRRTVSVDRDRRRARRAAAGLRAGVQGRRRRHPAHPHRHRHRRDARRASPPTSCRRPARGTSPRRCAG